MRLRGCQSRVARPSAGPASSLRQRITALIQQQVADLATSDRGLLVDHLMDQLEPMEDDEREESIQELKGTSAPEWREALEQIKEAQNEGGESTSSKEQPGVDSSPTAAS